MVTYNETLDALRRATNGQAQRFQDGQWEAIDVLVNHRGRVLLVQRTGWGKSMVYFLATRALRNAGAGPTLIISPLLSLMRNQLTAARSLGLNAETINTSNRAEWDPVMGRVRTGDTDLLLVSPERLANDAFLTDCLLPIAGNIALLVVDEAHCISDWGHDFRPDYQRIERIIRQLPSNVAVLATTATANDRVVEDVMGQLGPTTVLQRGPLARDSLRLQTTPMPGRAARLAWLANALPRLPGSGIVYTLTTADAERVATWLQKVGIQARAYHSKVEGDEGAENEAGPGREELERMLIENEIKVLVATSALGMGFDKPDLGFVIHFQAPQSIVHYYQQVGRAGRGIPDAVGVLLSGEEDEEINRYFIDNAFPPVHHIRSVLDELEAADSGLSVPDLTHKLNLRRTQIEKVFKVLSVTEAAPVIKREARWYRTTNSYRIEAEHVRAVIARRWKEYRELQAYLETNVCLMRTLCEALNDPNAEDCGRCENCRGKAVINAEPDHQAQAEAARFLRRSEVPLAPRKQWETGAFDVYRWRGLIRNELRLEAGRALATWRDGSWGSLVDEGKQNGFFSDRLVEACVDMIRNRWQPSPTPTWVTCVPSSRSADLVPDFSQRLATALGLPFRRAVTKVRGTERQRDMRNSWQQARNLDGAFEVDRYAVAAGPVLLVDDIADSRWSLTIIGALLRTAGAGPVHPCVLALAKGE